MLVKNRVRITTKNTLLLYVGSVTDKVWMAAHGHESMLVSGEEGKHSEGSLHPKGMAWDFRTRRSNDLRLGFYYKSTLEAMVRQLKKLLGSDFDVVLEKDHIHIERDPK